MWPYTNDEFNWLAIVAVMTSTDPRPLDPPSIAELEVMARRARARVIAGLLKDAFHGTGRLIRAAFRRRSRLKALPGAPVSAD